jgi:acetyltransferase-like isoleucine patch superfamily enzyme
MTKLLTVGDHTYGSDDLVIFKFNKVAKCNIGKYCSIADNIKIFLGGNHRYDWISTYPFGLVNQKVFDVVPCPGNPYAPGDIIIGNDVWIGHSATIMSGVIIGDGAVIAANSHIVKDIEPYTVVGGNPAQFVKKRFDDNIIKLLLELKWWDLSDSDVKELIPILHSSPTATSIKNLILKYRPEITR